MNFYPRIRPAYGCMCVGMLQSCNSVITILDDMLIFDKLENGIRDIDLKPVKAWSFVRDTIRPFLMRVRIPCWDISG